MAQQVPLEDGKVPPFSSSTPLAVQSAQDESTPHRVFKAGVHYWEGDLRGWTDVAVAEFEAELASRGVPVSRSAERALRLSISSAYGTEETFVLRCETTLRVDVGEKFPKHFKGMARTQAAIGYVGWLVQRACDRAIARAVGLALNDETVLAFIQGVGTETRPSNSIAEDATSEQDESAKSESSTDP